MKLPLNCTSTRQRHLVKKIVVALLIHQRDPIFFGTESIDHRSSPSWIIISIKETWHKYRFGIVRGLKEVWRHRIKSYMSGFMWLRGVCRWNYLCCHGNPLKLRKKEKKKKKKKFRPHGEALIPCEFSVRLNLAFVYYFIYIQKLQRSAVRQIWIEYRKYA